MTRVRQARQSLDATKKRVTESEKRIDTSLEPFIKKNYWCGPALVLIFTRVTHGSYGLHCSADKQVG